MLLAIQCGGDQETGVLFNKGVSEENKAAYLGLHGACKQTD